nr:unnamed protein product [Digitaria exilis]
MATSAAAAWAYGPPPPEELRQDDRADSTTATFAGVTATVALMSFGLAAARFTARSVKGRMWLVPKKGKRMMCTFLLGCLPQEAIFLFARGNLCTLSSGSF